MIREHTVSVPISFDEAITVNENATPETQNAASGKVDAAMKASTFGSLRADVAS
jgi:hypothetical protein